MDDIDDFLNSIEDSPSTTKRGLHGTNDAEYGASLPLDAELEALFDDFNSMLTGTEAIPVEVGSTSKDCNNASSPALESEVTVPAQTDLASATAKGISVELATSERFESVLVGIAPESVAASIYQQTIDPPQREPTTSYGESNTGIGKIISSTTSEVVNKANEGDDFLCWLDDVNSSVPESQKAKQLQGPGKGCESEEILHASTTRAAFLEFLQKGSITDPIPPRTTVGSHTSVASSAAIDHMDAFFEEVFGVTSEEERHGTETLSNIDHVSSEVHSLEISTVFADIPSTCDSNGRDGNNTIQNDTVAELINFNEYLTDVSNGRVLETESLRVRASLFQHRFLPAKHRGGVYLYLLGEPTPLKVDEMNVSLEDIAAALSASSQTRITEDSKAAVERVNGTPQMLVDMKVVLSLFCLRRGVEYHPLYTYLLFPLLCGESPLPLSAAHNLFYKLTTEFIPILDLPSKSPHCVHHPGLSIDAAVGATNQWLRLLLGYHNPLLMHHLDRIVPGWEQPLVWDIDGGRSMAPGMTYLQRHNRHKIMGESMNNIENKNRILPVSTDTVTGILPRAGDFIVGVDIPAGSPTVQGDAFDRNNNGNDIASAHPSKGKTPSSGHIPVHFLCAIFSSSVPCEQALELLDWAVVSGERFAGVYLTAALLHIFSVFLRNMTGSEAREWFSQVAAGDGSWYKSTLLPTHRFFPNDSQPIPEFSQQNSLSWAAFISGWIHTASAIRRHTPFAFRDALVENDRGWAQEVARRVREEDASLTASHLETHHISESADVDNLRQDNCHENSNDSNKFIKGSAVMSSFRRLSMLASNTAGALGSVLSNSGSSPRPGTQTKPESRLQSAKIYYPHDRYLGGQNVCIWVGAHDVIPCFFGKSLSGLTGTSAYKRPRPLPTLDSYYSDSLKVCASVAGSGDLNMQFPRLPILDGQALSERTYDTPYYLCLDCRTDAERNATGIFPKALVLDVNFVQDLGRIAEVLTLLEPFAQKVHLCIMGSGEAYVRYIYHRHKLLRPNRTERRLNIGGDGTTSGRIFAMARSVTGVGAKSNNSNSNNDISSSASSSSGKNKHDLNNDGYSRQCHEDEPALVELLSEYRQQLSTIAMFFLKKSFKHISILDGGFLGVVECLAHMISTKKGASATGPPFSGQDGDLRWPAITSELSILIPNSNMHMIQNLLTGKLDAVADAGGDVIGVDIDAQSTSSTSLATSSRLLAMARNSVNQAAAIMAGGGHAPVPALTKNKVSGGDALDSQTHGVTSSSKDVEDMLSHYTDIADAASKEKLNAKLSQNAAANSYNSDTTSSFTATSPLSSFTLVGASMSNSLASLGGSVKKRFSIFGGSSSGSEAVTTPALSTRSTETLVAQCADATNSHNLSAKPAFVIDDEEDIPAPQRNHHTNVAAAAGAALQKVSKTEAEKAEAIAIHRLNGLKVGDSITISKQDLPGTVLFPATKYRATNAPISDVESPVQELEMRFLVVSRERFLVLRTIKGTIMGVGGQALVVLNEHLTQLLRMTFRKRDPEMVTMYFSADGSEGNCSAYEDDEDSTSTESVRRYRVSKRAELVSALQKNMQRFK